MRIWIPSPNYSSSRSRNQLLVVHTSEGATTFRSLGNFLANPSSGVSYQVGFDDTTATDIGEYVRPNNKAWAAMNANDWGEHGCCCTPSGASQGWSRSTWLSKDRMLRACAGWLAEEASRYGIPLVKVDANGIRAGRPGICGHGDCSAAGAGGSHTDPGPNFPWDVVIGYASGQPTTQGTSGGQEDGPVTIATAPGRVDLFVIGTDNGVWQAMGADYDSLLRAPWIRLGKPGDQGKSVAVAWTPDYKQLYVTVHGTDNKPWVSVWDGKGWSPFTAQEKGTINPDA